MTNRNDFQRQAERARKAFAHRVAMAADAKGAKAERRAQRQERIARRSYLEACRLSDLDAYAVEG